METHLCKFCMNRKATGILLGLSVVASANAQYARNQVELQINGGVHSLLYDAYSSTLSHQSNLGGGTSFNYRHFFNDYLGIGTGLGISFFNTYGKISSYDEKIDLGETKGYILANHFQSWEEKQKYAQLEIPIGAYYRNNITYSVDFLVGAGIKIGLPVRHKFEVTEGSLSRSTYYLESNESFPESIDKSLLDFEGKMTTKKANCSLFLDFGLTKWFTSKLGVYGGLYVNYGLTDIIDSPSDQKLFSENGVYTNMLECDQITKVASIAAGFKMAVTLPTDRVKKKHEMPENKEILSEEPMVAPEVKEALMARDSIHHLPDSLIYIRYSREEVAKVKKLISELGVIEDVTEEKKVKYRNTITAYDTLSSFEKLDITWNERRHLKFAEYALNAEEAIKMLSEEMSSMFSFPFNESGFTSTEDMEVAFEDIKVLLRLQPNKGLLIKGHADKMEMDYNDAIGIERAFFIRDILKDKGTAADQLDVKDMKDKEPVDVSGTDEGKAKNRRVTFSIYEEE